MEYFENRKFKILFSALQYGKKEILQEQKIIRAPDPVKPMMIQGYSFTKSGLMVGSRPLVSASLLLSISLSSSTLPG